MLLFLIGCNAESENDASKRNADWVWWVDEHTGKGEWIKSGDHTTVKDGKYTMFYYNGNVYSNGRLKNGVAIDTIYGYDLNGNLDCYDVVVSNEQRDFYAINNGPFLKLFPDGKKAFEGFVINHKTGNYWKIFNKNGILIHETNFIDSPRFTAKYYDNGKLKLKYIGDVHYIDSFHNWDLNNGVKREYYSNGNLKIEEYHKNGLANGLQTEYFQNGQVEAKAQYKDGEIFGSGFIFYENGKLKKDHKFEKGKENGTCIDYYENGKISAIGNYKDGIIDGKVLTWYENGNMKNDMNFSNGKESGICKAFFENGNIKMIATIKDGKLDGKMIKFDSLGKNPKEYFYKDGVEIVN